MRPFLAGCSLLACVLSLGAQEKQRVLEGADAFLFDPRLAELFENIDPAKAGWESEVFQDDAVDQLHGLCGLLEADEGVTEAKLASFVADGFRWQGLRPAQLEEVFSDSSMRILRGTGGGPSCP